MPGSLPVFDAVLERFVARLQPDTALDIGAGAGKTGRILQRVAPACRSTALEVEPRYVEEFALPSLYGRVLVADGATWWRDTPEECFDLVVAGDCLEHMDKSDGLDLLNAMTYRSAWTLVLTPEFIVQGAVGGAASEVHRSVWSERDFAWHDLWAWDNTRAMTLVLLRGYLPSPLSIDALVGEVNDGQWPLHDFDGEGPVRPCRLRLVDAARETAYRPR